MLLAHDVIGDESAPHGAIFLHGILGSRNNWKSFAQRFVAARPSWRAVIADLRNHGDSHGFAPPHTIAACADDVRALATELGRIDAIVGHSYGGKVALALLDASPLRAVWSLDAPPGPRSFADDRNGGGEIERVLAAVRAVPVPIASRRALVDDLKARGLSEPLALWMTTNVRAVNEGALTWRFALDTIDEMLRSFGALDLWPALERRASSPVGAPRVILVQAERGARYTSDDVDRAQTLAARGALSFRMLANAGHWLHTDNPAGLLALLDADLEKLG